MAAPITPKLIQGTPFCVTVDFDTITQKTVTVRERDAMTQERISVDQLDKYFNEKIYNVK